jgi:hypothetical protein
MNLGGVTLTVLLGRTIPVPAQPQIMLALESVEVSHSDSGRSGFQLVFTAGRRLGLSTDYDLLTSPMLAPFNRVVLVVTMAGVPHVISDGIITHQQLVPGDGPGGALFAVTGEDISVMMDLEERSIEHPAQTAELSVELILTRYLIYGITPVVIPSLFVDFPLPLERVPIQHATDLGYIQSLAELYGYVFYVRAGPLPLQNLAYWGPPARIGTVQKALTVNMGAATNVEGVQFTYDALAPTLVRGEVQDLEFGTQVPVETTFSTRLPPLATLPALLAQYPNVRVRRLRNDGEDDLQSFANAQGVTDRSVDAVVQASGELQPARYGGVLSARDLVGVRGAGWQYDGLYHVQSVTHRLGRQDYTQSFVLTREGVGATVPVVRL